MLKTTRNASLSAALLIALAGCKVGPDYKQPSTAEMTSWYQDMERGVSDSPADLSRWWTTLGDPMLDGLIDRAIVGNLDLKVAEARIRETRAQRGVVASNALPQVDVGAGYSRQKQSQNASNGEFTPPGSAFNLYDAEFDAAWEIDVFGRVGRAVESADADIQAAEETRRDVLVTLISEVARNYVEARGFQTRVEIARENIRIQTESVDITTARYKSGLTSDLDVARAEAQLAATQSAIPVLETGYRVAVYNIAVLLGVEPGPMVADFESTAPIPPPPAAVAVGIPAELVRRRPDIRTAERQVAAANALIGAATADLFPRFSLTGSFGYTSNSFGEWTNSTSQFWSIGPAVRWPIFEGGRLLANIKVQDARTEQAVAIYEKSVLTAYAEVESAMTAFMREQSTRDSLEKAVAANRRAADLANTLYVRGLAGYLTVIDAQRALFETQDLLARSRQAVATDLIALYKALGGGWEAFEPKPETTDQPDETAPAESAPPMPADEPRPAMVPTTPTAG